MGKQISRRVWLHSAVGLCLLLGGCGKSFNPDEELLAELAHKEVKHRRTAAFCIREMRPVPASYIPALLKALDDEDTEVRQSAAAALGEVGTEGRPYLNEIMKQANEHADTQVRVALQLSAERINHSQ
jgi:HEAT repeat protein